MLEVELVHIVLGLECQDLVLGLLAQPVSSLCEAIALLDLFN